MSGREIRKKFNIIFSDSIYKFMVPISYQILEESISMSQLIRLFVCRRSNWNWICIYSTIYNYYVFLRLSIPSGYCFIQIVNYIFPLNNLAKNNMFSIEPWTWSKSNKELGPVCIFPRIGHRKQIWFFVGYFKVLVSELLSVNRYPTSAISFSEVSSLSHKV